MATLPRLDLGAAHEPGRQCRRAPCRVDGELLGAGGATRGSESIEMLEGAATGKDSTEIVTGAAPAFTAGVVVPNGAIAGAAAAERGTRGDAAVVDVAEAAPWTWSHWATSSRRSKRPAAAMVAPAARAAQTPS